MTRQRDRTPPPVWQLVQEFLLLDEAGFPAWRAAHCPTCRKYPDPGERAQWCVRYRCGMVDREVFHGEQGFVDGIMPRLWREGPFDDKAIVDLNEYIAAVGSTTPALVKGVDGIYREGLSTKTLRAQLHAAIFSIVSALAGNTIKGNTHESKAHLALQAKREKDFADWVQRQRVVALKDGQGLTWSEVRTHWPGGPSLDTLKNWRRRQLRDKEG